MKRWLTLGLGLAFLLASPLWNQGRAAPPCCPDLGNLQAADLGVALPDLTLQTLEGETLKFRDLLDRPVVLFVMASWCLSCVSEAKALGKLWEKYGDKVTLVAVDVDRSTTPERLKRFKEAAGNPGYIWAMDPKGEVVRAFRVRTLDTTLIFDAQGKVVYRDERPTSFETLDRVVGELLKGA